MRQDIKVAIPRDGSLHGGGMEEKGDNGEKEGGMVGVGGGNGIRKQVLARIFHVKPEEWKGFKCPRCIWNELSLA